MRASNPRVIVFVEFLFQIRRYIFIRTLKMILGRIHRFAEKKPFAKGENDYRRIVVTGYSIALKRLKMGAEVSGFHRQGEWTSKTRNETTLRMRRERRTQIGLCPTTLVMP